MLNFVTVDKMKSSSNSKQNSSSKSKKSARNRERRKTQSQSYADNKPDHSQQPAPIENSFKDDGLHKYTGIGRDSVTNYLEQVPLDNQCITDEASFGLAEDLSYKLRLIIHASTIKARLCGRNSVMGCDVEETLTNLQVDKVYGAVNNLSFVPFSDKNLYYLDDTVTNLVEIAEEVGCCIQPSNIEIRKNCIPDDNLFSSRSHEEHLLKYFQCVCFAVITSDDEESKSAALDDLSSNYNIIPIANWFYRFCILQLHKFVTQDVLFDVNVLYLLQSLERNFLVRQMVTEKEIIMLFEFLLTIFQVKNDYDVIKETIRTLKVLCIRLPLEELLLSKLNNNEIEEKDKYPSIILSMANALGPVIVAEIVPQNLLYFLLQVEKQHQPLIAEDLLVSYYIMHKFGIHNEFEKDFYSVFGEALVPLWKSKGIVKEKEKQELPVNYNKLIFKSRRKVAPAFKPSTVNSVAEMFQLYSFNMNGDSSLGASSKQTHIIVGKRSDYFSNKRARSTKQCCDHSMSVVLI